MSQVSMVGELVHSDTFPGIGKLSRLNHESGECEVVFFESPLNPEARRVGVNRDELRKAPLYEEAIVYCRDSSTGIWRRGRYGGARPFGRHLVIFRVEDNDQTVLSIDDIYCLNLGASGLLDPSAFLANRANDAPFFCSLRHDFFAAYIEQRAACRSIGAITSSSVELEPHQIAVVRRVLQDPSPKYLLADEVGLGKTIEAGLIIREHVLERKRAANVLIAVPAALLGQWHAELVGRFHLGEVISLKSKSHQLIRVCSHEQLEEALLDDGQPSLLVVDEAHQLAPLAWSTDASLSARFRVLAKACQAAEATLLLSGTPLNGNERNFLAMLHCLSPEAYELSEMGVRRFITRVEQREWLGGLHSALTPGNSNAALEQILQDLGSKFPEDQGLQDRINSLLPLVDLFADETGVRREQEVIALRKFIGENYRLHQRMLRNRREMGHLAQLFPGLAGLRRSYWHMDPRVAPLDMLLEEYRSLASRDPDNYQAMSPQQYLEWVDDLLVSPLLVERRATQASTTRWSTLQATEREFLADISRQALREQECKDRSLFESVGAWLAENAGGKVVVFCGDCGVAEHVFAVLKDSLTVDVELYIPGGELQFLQSSGSVRVLVCDQGGEDGLNLHGGRRLAVHYSLPRSFSRIEQRLGRLNRYSANLPGVRPVESLALLSDHDGLFRRWLDLLDSSVGLFSQTVASLQYVLEEHIEQAWVTVAQSGDEALLVSAMHLGGENGVLARERRRVKVQEELLALDEDVENASQFAEQIAHADEVAEEQIGRMCTWMTRGLSFKLVGSLNGLFKLGFAFDPIAHGGRTLVDVQTFIEGCITGIDPDSGNPPYTASMSFSRQQVSGQAGAYPFRYGQPFVDSIYDLTMGDSRGATSAFLRVLDNSSLQAPKVFFRLNWLVSATGLNCTRQAQIIGDELLAPAIYGHWLTEDGSLVTSESTLRSLEWPYKKPAKGVIRDLNLRHDVWPELEFLLPASEWKRLVLNIAELSRQQVRSNARGAQNLAFEPQLHLMSIHAQILCSKNLLEKA